MMGGSRLRGMLRRGAAAVVAVLLVVWMVGVGSLAWAMGQTPERFGRFMSHMPIVAFIVLPFETLWNVQRRGVLHMGDAAPDFSLATVDKTAQVQLASFRGKRPVVLVFGSYT